MNFSLISKLESLQKRYEEIKNLLSDPVIINNYIQFFELSKEFSQLIDIITCFAKWQKIQEDIYFAKKLLLDPEMYNLAQEEIQNSIINQKKLEKCLKAMLLPKNNDDNRGCFLEVRAGTGGNEAALFAGDLFRMYMRYIENLRWKVEIISTSNGEHGGYKEIIAKIIHQGAYGRFKFESGGHRVQRIPETESQGRIHTSSCTVAVMPDIVDAELQKINLCDLRIDTFRSSGAGGQHVNTTDSAIRITHLPTNIVVECQDERSQHKNKAKALSVLGARLRAAELQRKQQEESNIRHNLLGSGNRYDRIRTYNFPQSRVTDHRINLTIYRLEEIIEGKLDLLIHPIIEKYEADQIIELSNII